MSAAPADGALVVRAQQRVPGAAALVFALLADPVALPRWQAGVRWAERDGAGPPGVGTTVTAERALPGRGGLTVRYVTEVTDWEPPHLVGLTLTPSTPAGASSLRGLTARGSYRLAPAGEGTLVTAMAEVPLVAPLRVGPLRRRLEREVRRALTDDLDGLARLVADRAA